LTGCNGLWLVRFLPPPPSQLDSLMESGYVGLSMSCEDKKGHKGETQTTSDPVVTGLYRKKRKDGTYSPIWQFRLRVPTDLLPLYAPKKDLKRTLETESRSEAKEKAAILHAQYVLEFHNKRQELVARKIRKKPIVDRTSSFPDPAAEIRTQNSSFRRFSTVKDSELETIVVKEFLMLESAATNIRNQSFVDDYGNVDLQGKDELIYNLQVDHMSCIPDSHYFTAHEWESDTITTLAKHSIALDSIPREMHKVGQMKFEKFSNLLRQAHAESLWRTITTIEEGKSFAEQNPFFSSSRLQSYQNIELSSTSSTALTLGELCDKFNASRKDNGIRERSLQSYQRVFRIATDFFGADTGVTRITIDDVERFVAFLKRLPISFKQDSKLSVLEYAERSSLRAIACKTQQDLFDDIKAIFALAERRRWIEFNPFLTDLRPSEKRSETRKRQPLSREELVSFFTSDLFTKEREKYPAKYWVTLLSLFHGLRVNEASSLHVTDIAEKDGIHFINIAEYETEDIELKKILKNKASKRRVPLHKSIIALGFLDYVTSINETRLFPTIKSDKDGSKGQTVSKWFNYHRKKFVDPDTLEEGDKVFHTLRHSFATELRRQGVPKDILQVLGGWGTNEESFSDSEYGEYPLEVLSEHINKVDYSFIHFRV